jgi:hypothetical protein
VRAPLLSYSRLSNFHPQQPSSLSGTGKRRVTKTGVDNDQESSRPASPSTPVRRSIHPSDKDFAFQALDNAILFELGEQPAGVRRAKEDHHGEKNKEQEERHILYGDNAGGINVGADTSPSPSTRIDTLVGTRAQDSIHQYLTPQKYSIQVPSSTQVTRVTSSERSVEGFRDAPTLHDTYHSDDESLTEDALVISAVSPRFRAISSPASWTKLDEEYPEADGSFRFRRGPSKSILECFDFSGLDATRGVDERSQSRDLLAESPLPVGGSAEGLSGSIDTPVLPSAGGVALSKPENNNTSLSANAAAAALQSISMGAPVRSTASSGRFFQDVRTLLASTCKRVHTEQVGTAALTIAASTNLHPQRAPYSPSGDRPTRSFGLPSSREGIMDTPQAPNVPEPKHTSIFREEPTIIEDDLPGADTALSMLNVHNIHTDRLLNNEKLDDVVIHNVLECFSLATPTWANIDSFQGKLPLSDSNRERLKSKLKRVSTLFFPLYNEDHWSGAVIYDLLSPSLVVHCYNSWPSQRHNDAAREEMTRIVGELGHSGPLIFHNTVSLTFAKFSGLSRAGRL